MKRLTLSFDNGPDPEVTPMVLDELARRGLTATFFVVGEKVAAPGGQDLLGRMTAAGHRIGNHTYSHPRPLGALPPALALAEIDRTDALIEPHLGLDRLFRPSAGGGSLRPGVLTDDIVDHLARTGHTIVLWNVICEDWCRPDGSWIEIALKQIAARDWSLIVLHDIAGGGMAHLPRFLDAVKERCVTITADLPPDYLPMQKGRVTGPLGALIA